MKKKLLTSAICIILFTSAQLFADTVSSISQLQSAINNATAGTEIIVQNGTYTTNGDISINNIQGTSSNPVIIRAQSIGGVTIRGKAGFVTNSGTKYVIIKGFVFKHEAYHRSYNSGTHCTFTRNVYECIQNTTAAADGKSSSYLAINGSNNEVSYNTFQNKDFRGPILSLQGRNGAIAQNNWVHHNHFKNFPSITETNDNTAIQPGYGSYGTSKAKMIIEHNLFEDLTADGEGTLSAKCWDVTFRYNTIIDCNSTSLRNGQEHKVYGNYFFNSHIRFADSNHRLYNNVFVGSNGGIRLYSALDASKPSGYSHIRPVDCFVGYNTFYQNGVGFRSSGDGGSQNLKLVNNIFYDCNKAAEHAGASMDGILYSANIIWQGDRFDHPTSGRINQDPLFEYDSDGIPSIKSNSPAVNASSGSYSFVSDDMDGQSRSGTRDIGADELGKGSRSVKVLSASNVGPNAAEGPSGYTFAANENQTVNVSGSKDIAYGANGQFNYLYNQTQNVTCDNGTFGDPISGVAKKCYIRNSSPDYTPPGGYTLDVNEGGTVNVSGTINVAYGANGQFVFLYNQTGNISCNNNTFGSDPAPGVPKKCYVKSKGDIALGTYFLKNKASGNYLDSDGTIVRVKAKVGGSDQQWKLAIPQDQHYNIDNMFSGRGVLDADANDVVQGSSTESPTTANDKMWTVESLGNNTYRFKNAQYGEYLAEDNSTNVIEYTNWNGDRAQWILENVANTGKSASRLKTNVSESDSKLLVYPNPTKQSFTVKVTGEQATEISIYTVTGKRIYTSKILNNELKVNQKFMPGVYFLHIEDVHSNVITKKLIIN